MVELNGANPIVALLSTVVPKRSLPGSHLVSEVFDGGVCGLTEGARRVGL